MDFSFALKTKYLFFLEKGEIPSPFLFYCHLCDFVKNDALAKRKIRRYFDFDRKENLTFLLFQNKEITARNLLEEKANPVKKDGKREYAFLNDCIDVFLLARDENTENKIKKEIEENFKKAEAKKNAKESAYEKEFGDNIRAEKKLKKVLSQMTNELDDLTKKVKDLTKKLEDELKNFPK